MYAESKLSWLYSTFSKSNLGNENVKFGNQDMRLFSIPNAFYFQLG